jgi:hypothetical protein
LGDLPYLGAAFRFRNQTKNKVELMVILTPHVVRSQAEADQVLAAEARRMDWVLGDIVKVHGTTGLEPILPPPGAPPGPGGALRSGFAPLGVGQVPDLDVSLPVEPPPAGAPPAEKGPMPRLDSSSAAPQWMPPGPPMPATASPPPIATDGPPLVPTAAPAPAGSDASTKIPTDKGKDVGVWHGRS